MPGIGSITIDSAGAVPRPDSMSFTMGNPIIFRKHNKYSMISAAYIPSLRGVMMADGVGFIQNYIKDQPYRNSLLPSNSALSAAVTATKATTTLETNISGVHHTIVNGNFIQLVTPAAKHKIYFVNTRTFFRGDENEVYFNSAAADPTDDALKQLKKFINQTGVEGYDYFTKYDFSKQMIATTLDPAAPTAHDRLTIEAIDYGTEPNGWISTANVAAMRFEDSLGNAATFFTGGAVGTGSSPGDGTYQYGYTYVRKVDGAESGMSPITEISNAGAGQINLSNITKSTDTSVDYIRIYRTVNGGGLLYRVDEISNSGGGTGSYSDTKADSTITGFDALPFDPTLYRTYSAGLPPRVRYLAQFQGQWFGAGAVLAADYSGGSAIVTNNSRTVTISGSILGISSPAYVRDTWAGRTFQLTADSEEYFIVEADEGANTFVLHRPYEGASNGPGGNSSYTVKDKRDPYELFWTEPGMPNNWVSSLKGPSSPDGKGCTGLYAAFGSLIYFTRQNMWRISGTAGNFQVSLISDKAGCVGGHTIVMDGNSMYWLAQDGIYGWNGSGEPINMTTPPQQDVAVRGQDGTIARLNLTYAHRSIGVLDQKRQEIRWYVPLDGDRFNRNAFVFDTKNGVFSVDTCEDVTYSAVIQGRNAEDKVVTGDITGAIYQQGLSTADGGYGVEPVQSVSSSTTRTVTVSGTPFSTSDNGYWGCPVWHVSSTGEFTRNCIDTNTNNTITYRRFMTAPSASTQFVLGGILMWVQTGRFDFGDRYRDKIVPAYIVSHRPESDGQYFFVFSYDKNDFKIPTVGWTSGDLTVGTGLDDFGPRRRFRARKQGVLHGYGLICIEPGCSPQFTSVAIEVRGPSNLEI